MGTFVKGISKGKIRWLYFLEGVKMIFLAVGTQKFPYERLVRDVDQFAEKTGIEVWGQIGNVSYVPKCFQYERFISKQDYSEKIKACDMVITHSGVGTIIETLSMGKPVIVVPRLAKYGEHVDDHQVQIAEAFEENGLVLVCRPEDDLETIYEKAKCKKGNSYVSCRDTVIKTVEEFLSSL